MNIFGMHETSSWHQIELMFASILTCVFLGASNPATGLESAAIQKATVVSPGN